MKRFFFISAFLFAAAIPAAAQQPLYIVNGTPQQQIGSIPPDDIETIEALPADEQTIARYGAEAAGGVMLITLRYDQPATFKTDTTFSSYIAGQIKWDDGEPAARVILRYKITPEGETIVDQELESTDSRFRRRVLKAVAEAPRWTPACKNGQPVESEGVLRIQLPEGKHMPRPIEIVYR